jgi:crotonobetainyl-CoA:carnitine CoA-transferase CaiB-like acyl-CoA transferase
VITGALEGIRVLDLTNATASACGRFLADFGADVIKVEPPHARRHVGTESSAHANTGKLDLLSLHFDHNKRSITLDLFRADGVRIFRKLAAAADVIIESFAPGVMDGCGLGYETLQRDNERLVFASITPFGQDGPYREYVGGESVAFAFSGLMAVSGEPNEEPIVAPGHLACGMAAMHAALAIQVAILNRFNSERGARIDVSLAEAALHVGSYFIAEYTALGRKPVRTSHRHNTMELSDHYKCRDGYVRLALPTLANWQAFRDWVGNPPELQDSELDDMKVRQERSDLILPFIEDLCRSLTKEELYIEGQRRHLAISPVNTPSEFVNSSQSVARGIFVCDESAESGPYWHLNPIFQDRDGTVRASRHAPAVGEHTESIYRDDLGLSTEAFEQLAHDGVI